jgi:hypothetical protein
MLDCAVQIINSPHGSGLSEREVAVEHVGAVLEAVDAPLLGIGGD